MFLRAVEAELRRRSPGAPRGARFGAVAFEHRAGSFLNDSFHLHMPVTDGVFAATWGRLSQSHDLEKEEQSLEVLLKMIRRRWLMVFPVRHQPSYS